MIIKLQSGASLPLRLIRGLLRLLTGGRLAKVDESLREVEELSEVVDKALRAKPSKEERHYKGRDVPHGMPYPVPLPKIPPPPRPKSKDDKDGNSSND